MPASALLPICARWTSSADHGYTARRSFFPYAALSLAGNTDVTPRAQMLIGFCELAIAAVDILP